MKKIKAATYEKELSKNLGNEKYYYRKQTALTRD